MEKVSAFKIEVAIIHWDILEYSVVECPSGKLSSFIFCSSSCFFNDSSVFFFHVEYCGLLLSDVC